MPLKGVTLEWEMREKDQGRDGGEERRSQEKANIVISPKTIDAAS